MSERIQTNLIYKLMAQGVLFVLIFSFLNVCMFIPKAHASENVVDMDCGALSTNNDVRFQIQTANNATSRELDCCRDHGKIYQTTLNIREANDYNWISMPMIIVCDDLVYSSMQILSPDFIQDISPPPERVAQKSVVMRD